MVVARTGQTGKVRERLIEAATRLFAARGFDATPIQAIADDVGLTKPALLHHFPSKEHLRREVLSSILSYWKERLPHLLLTATASSDRFDAVFGELYRFFAAEPDRARFILREVLDRPEEARKLLRDVEPVMKAIAGYIRSGQEHGRHYRDADADAYVLHALQFVIGAVAIGDITAKPVLGAHADARARYDKELSRIAKASLFEARAGSNSTSGHDTSIATDHRERRRRRG